jgi:hypothetical protein
MDATEGPEIQPGTRRRQRDDPIVVGGLSATGRRSVAGLLGACGVEFPGPLSEKHISAWFTLLFRRPSFVELLRAEKRPLPAAVGAMQVLGSVLNGAELSEQELTLLAGAAAEVAAVGYEEDDEMPWWAPAVPFRHIHEYLARPSAGIGAEAWGWSHPLSHLFLEEAAAAFPGMRFVYVVRHPLETAFGLTRTDHLRLWGSLCGLTDDKIEASLPSAQLAFWLYSTRSAVDAGRRLLGDRFLMLWADQLIEHPVGMAGRIAAFAGIAADDAALREAAGLIDQLPKGGALDERRLAELDSEMVKRAEEWARGLSAKASAERESGAAMSSTSDE